MYSNAVRIEDLKKKLVEEPDNIQILIDIAVLYEIEFEDYAKAREFYQKALEISPNCSLILKSLEVLNDVQIHPNFL